MVIEYLSVRLLALAIKNWGVRSGLLSLAIGYPEGLTANLVCVAEGSLLLNELIRNAESAYK